MAESSTKIREGDPAPHEPRSGDGDGDATRAHILSVALELMAEKGFAATTTREISKRLGFTPAALYYHFRTKDDLLEAMVAPTLNALAELVDRAARPSSPEARRRLLRDYIDLVAARMAEMGVLSHDPSTSGRTVVALADPLYRQLGRLLADDDRPDTAARARVRVAIGGIHIALVRAEPGDDPATVRDAAYEAACGALGIPDQPKRQTPRGKAG